LRQVVDRLRSGELGGLNVTIPHKQAVLPLLDEYSPAVAQIGAANTLYRQGGRLVGENTDAPGFLADLYRLAPELAEGPKTALVLGAGGSARAVVYALRQAGFTIWLAARRLSQADEIASQPSLVMADSEIASQSTLAMTDPKGASQYPLVAPSLRTRPSLPGEAIPLSPPTEIASQRTLAMTDPKGASKEPPAAPSLRTRPSLPGEAIPLSPPTEIASQSTLARTDAASIQAILLEAASIQAVVSRSQPPIALIVNTTPLGMAPAVDASPWPEGIAFPAGAVLYDLVYNPQQTRLVQQARQAGLRAFSGLGMLVEQAALAFEIWTGSRVPRAVLFASLESGDGMETR
jgi:shikimate 5-dehydrogenase